MNKLPVLAIGLMLAAGIPLVAEERPQIEGAWRFVNEVDTRTREGWIFIAALSRERFDPFTKTEHVFVSFNQARDDFTRKLEETTGFTNAGHVELGNALAENPNLTTGDHDGRAVVLKARR
jgi:hypothetical protein